MLFSVYMLHLVKLFTNIISLLTFMPMILRYIYALILDLSAINILSCCLADIKVWKSDNYLSLNKNKTEVVALTCSHEVRNLGLVLESDLSFTEHFNNSIKAGFFHIRNIAKIRSIISLQMLKPLNMFLFFVILNAVILCLLVCLIQSLTASS